MMIEKIRDYIPPVISIGILYLFIAIFRLQSIIDQNDLLIFALVIFCLVIVLFKIESSDRKFIYSIIVIGASLLLLCLCWNILFVKYMGLQVFRGDIFRLEFYNYIAPLYGKVKMPSLVDYLLALTPGLILLFLAFFNSYYVEFRYYQKITGYFLVLISIVYYGLCNNLSFTQPIAHYSTYSNGLPYFKNIIDTLRYYTVVMNHLGIHNSHYPPGNLLLLKTGEHFGIPILAKAISVLLTAFTVFPFYAIMKLTGMQPKDKFFAMLLLITSAGIIIFPNIDLVSIPLFFFTASVFFYLQYMFYGKYSSAVFLGASIALFTFFSFSSSLLIFFIGINAAIMLLHRKTTLGKLVTVFLISCFTFFIFFLFCYVLTGFNLLDCFNKAVSNNKDMMSNGFDNIFRYLFRSTGAILAYLVSAGLVQSALFLNFTFEKRKAGPSTIKIIAHSLALTLVVSGFSGLFFLETERIWILFTPLVAIAGAITLQECNIKFGNKAVYFIITLSFLFSITQQLYLQHFL